MQWHTTAIASVLVIGLFVLRSVRRYRVGWKVWFCYQIALWQAVLFCRWRANNVCTIPEHGPAILVSNHTSPVDPSLLWIRHFAQFRHPRLRVIGFMVAKEYVSRRDPVGWVCRVMESIPVARVGQDMAAVHASLRRLVEGGLLGVFPEGRLNVKSPNDRLLPGGTGVGWLALRSRVPVIPIFIHNAPRGQTMVRSFFRWTRVSVTYGQPIDLSQWDSVKLTHAVMAAATDRIMQSLAQLGGIDFTPLVVEAKLPQSVNSSEF